MTNRQLNGIGKKQRRKKNEEKMTRLLITTMISFTLLTSPSCIYAIIDFNYNKGRIGGSMESLGINHRMVTAPCNLLLSCNYSLNFYLYCFANR